jgi:hypothetical protein
MEKKFQPLFDMSRVEEATAFIAAELRTLLDRNNIESHMSKRIAAACPAYKNGLTNGERLLATLRAFSMAQLEILAELGSMKHDVWVDDDDDVCDFDYGVDPHTRKPVIGDDALNRLIKPKPDNPE